MNALLDQYRLYSYHKNADPRADGVAFWGEMLCLSRQECEELVDELREVTRARHNNGPAAGRTRFHVSRIIPDKNVDGKHVPDSEDGP